MYIAQSKEIKYKGYTINVLGEDAYCYELDIIGHIDDVKARIDDEMGYL